MVKSFPQRHLIADFPAVSFGKLAPGNRTLAVGQNAFFVGSQHEFRIDVRE
jgi:hypothetical protein